MAHHAETTWEADTTYPSYPELIGDMTADVAIVGGGITGVTAAYLLAKAGKKVVIIEKDRLGSYATGMTTAIITRSIDMDTKPLIGVLGSEDAMRMLESHQHAITMIEHMITENKIDCEFVRDTNYQYANDDKDMSSLEEEYDALQKVNMPAQLMHEPLPGFRNAGAVALPDQAKFHPLKYLFGLAKAAEDAGAEIYAGSEVTHVEHDEKYKGPFTLETLHGTVHADYVLSATHLPFEEHQPVSLYWQKGRYDTYMMEVHLPKGTIPEGTYEDTENPYNYFRIDTENAAYDRMLIGGQDHRHDIPVNPDKNIQALEDYLKSIIPDVEYKIMRKWSGPIIEPTDGFAFIGPVHEGDRFLYATGYSGNGMTHGTLAGEILSGFVTGTHSAYEDLYRGFSTKGFTIKAIDYAGEIIGGAVENTFGYDHKKVEGEAGGAENR